jgi:drug/metabolite transporter (DMT)-like permease
VPNAELIGLVIGGLLPAVLFGVNGVLAKASTEAGIGLGVYLLVIGAGVTLTGVLFLFIDPSRAFSAKAGWLTLAMGVTWGLGVGLVGIALTKYGAPLSKLVPLYNFNTLVAVLLALWVFSEWEKVQALKLVLGAVLVIIGGTLVALA